MRLIEELKGRRERETSPFRAQLLKEDIARLARLAELAREHSVLDDFKKAGLYIGWTRDDMRTHELKEPLEALLEAVHAWAHGGGGKAAEEAILDAWIAFNALRIEKLVHCL